MTQTPPETETSKKRSFLSHLKKWMGRLLGVFVLVFLIVMGLSQYHSLHLNPMKPSTQTTYNERSQQLLMAARTGKPTQELAEQLATVSREVLADELSNDDARKAFWINIYNAYIQLYLRDDSTQYADKGTFFKTKRIPLAGEILSFDEIEHGILRRSKIKLSLGYVGKPFVGSFEKQFRVNELDPRIHFALNCGAKSCPAIAFFSPENLDEQMDFNARAYLSANTEVVGNTARITRLFLWFRGDFGGKKGTLSFLRKYDIIPADASPELIFDEYSWRLDLDNFVEMQ